MALRQIDIVLDGDAELDLGEADDHVLHRWSVEADDEGRLHTVIVKVQHAERVIECLHEREGLRALVARAIESFLPRDEDEDEDEDDKSDEQGDRDEPTILFARVSREEVRERMDDAASVDGPFIVLVVASTVVAAVGLALDNTAVVIGAMVIAPLVGPNLLLALSTALVDVRLAIRALIVNGTGVGLAFVLSFGIGWALAIDPAAHEITLRTEVSLADVALALAAGTAGALSVTRAVDSALIGVMVAAALLPPIVVSGMLLGSGHYEHAASAGLMLAVNLICVNLAAVGTFTLLGLKPRLWQDRQDAGWVVPTAAAVWILLLAAFIGLMWWQRGWEMLLLQEG